MSSFGEELRRERELRRISLREVAEATKINLRYLEALENNDFQHLPGGVYNRGFVRQYAKFIGVDPEDTVTAYLMEEQAQAAERVAKSVADGAPASAPDGAKRKRTGRWALLLLVLAALVAGAAFAYYRYVIRDHGAAEDSAGMPGTTLETRIVVSALVRPDSEAEDRR